MYHSPNRGQIRPKFSSMPRQRSEAAAFLDSYKLTVEKKRLQQELDSLNQRRDQIMQRLATIDQQVENLGDRAEQYRTGHHQSIPQNTSKPAASASPTDESSSFETLFVDY
ncbi:MAG: sugar ABC transporter ATP-binding protein [Cyanothece sp. SIO2G6]|nr:sugar ABC transporter ATP-binding protein [Cyanothece sp. SIO2G6]